MLLAACNGEYIGIRKGENVVHDETTAWSSITVETTTGVDYMSALEKEVMIELNKARTNPAAYAELYIEPMLSQFNGTVFTGYGYNLITREGVAAVSECVNAMKAQTALSALNPAKGLAKTAQEWAAAQGPTGETGHGSGTDAFSERIKKYGTYTGAGENISYGYNDARKIVIQLLVDDGVSNRGHRKNIFGNYTHAGIGCGAHTKYGNMCVIDFANNYSEK
ncbi:MAG: CAP domain-containing protein [Treponema sp.]|nr:CAP domain-containing protein [Treponema sp.]